jgi:DNA modification methylase
MVPAPAGVGKTCSPVLASGPAMSLSISEPSLPSLRRFAFGRAQPHEPDRLVHGDNLDVTATLADGIVDLVYIDPPFGTGTVRRGGQRGRQAPPDETRAEPHCYDDTTDDPERFVAWIEPRLAESRRVLAPHGSMFVHLDYRTVHYVKVALDRIFGRELLVNEIIWCYSIGGKSQRMFGRKHDTILWYARTPGYAFFPDAVRVPRKAGSHMRVARTAEGALVQEKTDRRTGKVYRYPIAAGKVPEDWWTDVELLNQSDRERTGWPTQKPERLIERIVRAASTEGALVADWFCGSGTTATVAQRLDRRFLIVDSAAEAVACAADRLAAAGQALAAAGRPPRDMAVDAAPAPGLPAESPLASQACVIDGEQEW